MDDRLAFLFSPPRSGSTMLARMLASHSRIYCRPEPQLIGPLHQLGYYGTVEHPGRNGPHRFAYSPLGVQDAIHSIVKELPRGEDDYLDALRAYLNVLYGRLLDKSGKALFVDKSPRNMHFYTLVRKLYPRARCLVLTRNPIPIGFSLRFQMYPDTTHVGGGSPDNWTLASISALSTTMAQLRRDVPHEAIRYEDLVTDPASELQKACAFLGATYEPEMVDYGSKVAAWDGPGDPFTVGKHTRPDASHANRWMKDLEDPTRRAFAKKILTRIAPADAVAAWGYPLDQLQAPLERPT